MLEQPAEFFDRLRLWFDLPAQGIKTTPEQPEPTRSDCHGWGAHPLYHYFASLLGILPSSFGFERVEIAPMPGHLTGLSGEMVHPRGADCRGLAYRKRLFTWNGVFARNSHRDIPLRR